MMCTSFKGKLTISELKEHLHYHSVNPEAIPFHHTQWYRPGKKTWGFCVPKKLYDSLDKGEYEVEIEVEHVPSTLKVLDFKLPGKSNETIVFQAHKS